MNNTMNKSLHNLLVAVTVIYLLPLYLLKTVDNFFFDEETSIADRIFYYGLYAFMWIVFSYVISVIY